MNQGPRYDGVLLTLAGARAAGFAVTHRFLLLGVVLPKGQWKRITYLFSHYSAKLGLKN